VDDVRVKEKSSFSGARTVIERNRHLYVNTDGEPVAVRYEHFINAERSGSKSVGRYAGVERQIYTPQDIEAIDKRYAAEEQRRAEPRWWEEVAEGDELAPVVKGPMGLVDVICAHLGWGFGGVYGDGPLRFGWKNRKAVPAFYVEDKYGVPGGMQRVHWDHDRAQDLGLPSAYDYGQMRTQWMCHLVTNWMGDDAWIKAYRSEARMFNFQGDTTLFTGRVTGKRIEGPHHLVDLDLVGTNQRDEATVVGSATVILPSRSAGPVVLPTPDLELSQRGARMMSRRGLRGPSDG
jgi:acyl dehydratase